MRSSSLTAVGLALCSALFFTLTYVLNRSLVAGGGHWQWAVILRYLFTLPLLATVLPWQGGLGALPRELRRHPRAWLLWSSVGFVLFGIPLTWAASSGPSWLIAGSFQITVLAGPLLAPLIYRDERRRLAWRSLAIGALIVAGVFILQWGHAQGRLTSADWLAIGAVALAAFAYPLWNDVVQLALVAGIRCRRLVYGRPTQCTRDVAGCRGCAVFGHHRNSAVFSRYRHGETRAHRARCGGSDAGRRVTVCHPAWRGFSG
jgi:drug/metabolite transporter (DMT)-like permease